MCNCAVCSTLPVNPLDPRKHIDPSTGIAPIHEWGDGCARGFVSHARFSRGADLIIERTNRTKTHEVYRRLKR